MSKKIFIFILLIFFTQNGIAFAQQSNFDFSQFFDTNTGLPAGVAEQISVEVIPKIPNPGDNVSISIESFSTDLNSAYFTWRVNGSVATEGNGLRNFNFFAPESGDSVTISVVINKEGGGTLSRSFTFSPADVDIIYEAGTYTPPFYKGKALFTSQSLIRFIAMPSFIENGSIYDPDELVYKWSINGKVDQDGSGYGKSIYYAQGSLVQRPFSVTVEVTAPNSSLAAKNTINVDDTDPEIVVYEDNPLLGVIFENAVQGDFLLNKSEVVLQAIPYYFSVSEKDFDQLNYSWRMNGNEIFGGSTTSSIRLRNDSGVSGRSLISLEAEHFQNILQLAQDSFNINFAEGEASVQNNFEF